MSNTWPKGWNWPLSCFCLLMRNWLSSASFSRVAAASFPCLSQLHRERDKPLFHWLRTPSPSSFGEEERERARKNTNVQERIKNPMAPLGPVKFYFRYNLSCTTTASERGREGEGILLPSIVSIEISLFCCSLWDLITYICIKKGKWLGKRDIWNTRN